MGTIKEYKPLALVFYIDGNGNRSALPIDENKVPQLKTAVETKRMIEIEGVVINSFDIKEIRPSSMTSEIEKFYYSRTQAERAKINSRITLSGRRKCNVIEALSEYGEYEAIRRMQKWLGIE